MFIGEYTHSIDQKRRMAVPSKFRKELGSKAVITRGLENCLVVYPLKAWGIEAAKLAIASEKKREARSYARLRLSGAMHISFDSLGRILIPDYLKKYAGLKKNAVIIGLGNRIEIWNQKKWQDYKTKIEANLEEIAEGLEESNV